MRSPVWQRRRKAIILSVLLLSAVMRLIVYKKLSHSEFYASAISVLGAVGEGFLKGHPLQFDRVRQQRIDKIQIAENRLVDFADIPDDIPEKSWIFDTKREPGYGILLGMLWSVFWPGQYAAIILLQNLIGAALGWLAYLQLRKLFPEWTALSFFTLYMLFPPVIRFENVAYTYTWANFGAIATAILVLHCSSTRQGLVKAGIGYGLFLGACYWIRSVVFPYVPLAMAGLWYLSGGRTAFKAFAGVAVGLAIILAPLPFVSQKIYKSWKPMRLTFWHTVWTGFGQVPNDFGAVWSDTATRNMVVTARPDIAPYTVEYEQFLRQRSLAVIREKPGFILRLALERLKRFTWADWNPFNQLPFKIPARLFALWSVLSIPFVFLLPASRSIRLARALSTIPLAVLGSHFLMAVEWYYIWPAQAFAVLTLVLCLNHWLEAEPS